MGSKGRKKKKEKGDKEDLCALHNGAVDAESGFVAVCPPDAACTSSCLCPGLCPKAQHTEEKVSRLFCNSFLPFCQLRILLTLYRNTFLPHTQSQGDHSCIVPHTRTLKNRVQTQVPGSPDSQSSPRQIFFRGAVRFKTRGVGGRLFFQPW